MRALRAVLLLQNIYTHLCTQSFLFYNLVSTRCLYIISSLQIFEPALYLSKPAMEDLKSPVTWIPTAAEFRSWVESLPEEFAPLLDSSIYFLETYKGAQNWVEDAAYTGLPVTEFLPSRSQTDLLIPGTGMIRLLASMKDKSLQACLVRNGMVVYVAPFGLWMKYYGPTFMDVFYWRSTEDPRVPCPIETALEIEAVARYHLANKGFNIALECDTLLLRLSFRRACRHQLNRLQKEGEWIFPH